MDEPTKRPNGRPPKPFDRAECEKLMGLWCTKEEIAGWFSMSVSVLERNCRAWADEIGIENGTFDTLRNIYSANTKASLRRTQIAQAMKGNTGLLIWLGKQILGQREHAEPESASVFQLKYALDDLD